ncbi:MAG: hypothetical protein LBQ47_06420 [Endomicrobium sp.]|jgi:hypothetical protein|nr:hypothetical protein [Endomicrobium sp.]
MKKLFLAAVAVLFAVTASFAIELSLAGLGVSVKGGTFLGSDRNNFDDLSSEYRDYLIASGYNLRSYDSTGFSGGGIDIFYEYQIAAKQSVVLSIGYTYIDDNEYGFWGFASEYNSYGSGVWNRYTEEEDIKITSKASAIPLNIYYKYAAARKFNISAGFGVNIISNKFEYTRDMCYIYESNDPSNDYTDYIRRADADSQTVIVPTVNINAEFLITKYVGIFANLGYGFSGKAAYKDFSADGDLYRDFSGANIYFGINVYPFAFKNK